MTNNQDALMCADVLEQLPMIAAFDGTLFAKTGSDNLDKAAAHIRRLVAENETFQQKLRSTEATLQRGREVWNASAEAWNSDVAERDALLRQALELLEDNREDVARVETTYMHKCYDPVLHAIKHHLGEKE